MTLLLRLCAACQTKSYASGNDLFPVSVFWMLSWKTGNTGMEKLSGRTHSRTHSAYRLYRLLEDSSMKSYGEEKTHLNSTNNTNGFLLYFSDLIIRIKIHRYGILNE
jgi:hypothetical protein